MTIIISVIQYTWKNQNQKWYEYELYVYVGENYLSMRSICHKNHKHNDYVAVNVFVYVFSCCPFQKKISYKWGNEKDVGHLGTMKVMNIPLIETIMQTNDCVLNEENEENEGHSALKRVMSISLITNHPKCITITLSQKIWITEYNKILH